MDPTCIMLHHQAPPRQLVHVLSTPASHASANLRTPTHMPGPYVPPACMTHTSPVRASPCASMCVHNPVHLTCIHSQPCTAQHTCMHGVPLAYMSHLHSRPWTVEHARLTYLTYLSQSVDPSQLTCISQPVLMAPHGWHGAAHAQPMGFTHISQHGCTIPRSSPISQCVCTTLPAQVQLTYITSPCA